MKKQRIQFILLTVTLILCIGGYFIIKNINSNQPKQEETSTIQVTSVTQEDVTEMEYNVNDETLDLVKNNDKWEEKNHKSVPINQSEIATMLEYACNLTTTTKIDESEALSTYGLDNPSNVISLTLKDGSVVQIMIGDYLSITGEYYAMTSGDSFVYTIPSYMAEAFLKTIDDLTQAEETTQTTD